MSQRMGLFQRFLTGGAADEPPAEEYDEAAPRDEYSEYEAADATESLRGALSFDPNTLVKAEPRTFREAGRIVDCLRRGQPVVVCLEQTEQAEAVRIRDFLKGAAYALDGDVRKVASRVYICLPSRMRYEILAETDAERAPAPHLAAPADTAGGWQQ